MRHTIASLFRKTAMLRRGVALSGVIAGLVLTGFGCKGESAEITEATRPFTIKYWRVFDDMESFEQPFVTFQSLHPHITIEYRRFRYEEYERELLKAISEDRGPDVMSLPASWMNRWQPRLLPVPEVLSVPYRETRGSIKKEVVTVIRKEPGITLKQLADEYADVVAQDVVIPTEQADPRLPPVPKIYGLPLAMDTLVMYYNRDLLNRAGVAQPATDWKTFHDQVKRITKLDETGAIIQSATALGTADNVERASDVLGLLMMQNGAPMTSAEGTVTFDKYPPELAGRPYPPAAEALIFYTDFANPEKEVYSWNDKMPNSLQAFQNGQTAFFFGYSYHLPQIRLASPKLNFGIAPFPQIEGNQPVNMANYWVETVSNKTEHPDEVWDFVQFMAKEEQVRSYLGKARKPTARRNLLNGQLEDPDLSVFASQVPTAKSWYHGTDPDATEKAFQDMIRQMLQAEADPRRIVELGATKVNQTIR